MAKKKTVKFECVKCLEERNKFEALADALLGFAMGIQLNLKKSDKQIVVDVKEILRKIRASMADPKLVRKMRSFAADTNAK